MKNKIKSFLIKFGLPFFTITFYFIFRTHTIDKLILIPEFTFVAIFTYFHTVVGGFWSGAFTTIYFTIIGTFLYITPIQSFYIFNLPDVFKINLSLFTGFFVTFVISAFVKNQKMIADTASDLLKNSKRLRKVMDNIYTMINITDKQGRMLEANKSYLTSINLELKDILKKSIFDIEPWVSNPILQEKLRNAMHNLTIDNSIMFESSFKINNKTYYVEVGLTMIVESNFEEIVITVRDRTDKKLYEDELIKSKDILTKLINSNVIGMAVANLNGSFVEANDKFLEILGYTLEQFKSEGISWIDATPKDQQKFSDSRIEEIKKKGFMQLSEKEYIHRKGHKVPVLITGVSIGNGNVLCLILDLTTQKTVQQRKDEFVSLVSHELKTPMTVIKGYVQLLSKRLSSQEKDYSHFLNTIDFQINKLNSLVNELHDISKIQSNKLSMNFKTINLNDVVRHSIDEIRPFQENHIISFVENYSHLEVRADLLRIEQVLTNLITNAIKYSPDGGEVVVTLSKVKNHAVLSVKDSGVGIAKHNIDKIFTKFFQVDSSKELSEGMGLGLYISKEIIQKHNGTIKVDSLVGQGSTFTIEIPLV